MRFRPAPRPRRGQSSMPKTKRRPGIDHTASAKESPPPGRKSRAVAQVVATSGKLIPIESGGDSVLSPVVWHRWSARRSGSADHEGKAT